MRLPFFLLVLPALVHALTLNSTSAFFQSVDGGEGGKSVYTVINFIIDFNEPVFFKTLNSSNGPYIYTPATTNSLVSMDQGLITSGMKYGAGSVTLHCNGNDYHTSFGPIQDPSGLILIAPSTAEPAASFVSIMSGVVYNEKTYPNRVAFLLVAGFDQGSQHISLVDPHSLRNCTASFSTTATYSNVTNHFSSSVLSDANGNVINLGPVTFPPVKAGVCTLQAFENMKDLFSQFVTYATSGNILSSNVGNLGNLMTGVLSRVGWTQCRNDIQSFFNYTMEEITVPGNGDTGCHSQYGTDEFLQDPCCNWNLRTFYCCAPKNSDQVVKIPSISNIDTTKLNSYCTDPSRIEPLFFDFTNYLRTELLLPPIDTNSLTSTYTSFVQTCQKAIYQQACTANSQCYSGTCQTNNNPATCYVPWGNETSLLLRCYLDKMSSDVKFELEKQWGLPAVYPSVDAEVKALSDYVSANFFIMNCVGQDAWQYSGHWTSVQNPDGTWNQVYVPGNQTACESDVRCNYNGWDQSRQTQQGCLAGPSNFCAYCQGNDMSNCQVVTQYPTCTNNLGSSDCHNANGTYVSQYGYGQCYFGNLSSIVTQEQCYAGSPCANFTQGNWMCNNQVVCYKSNMTSDSCYNGNPGQTFFQEGVCFKWVWSADQCPTNNGYSLYYGKWYYPGQFHTPELCSQGMCNYQGYLPGVNVQQLNATECSKLGYCTNACAGCQYVGYGGQGFNQMSSCIQPSYNQTVCSGYGGNWRSNVLQNGGGLCFFDSYNNDQISCQNNNYTYISCDSFTTTDQCNNNSTYSNFMTCQWSQWTQCKDRASCSQTGTCNDWVFNSQCEWNTCQAGQERGVCISPFVPSPNVTTQCNGLNQNWGQIGCIITNITTHAGCISAGYNWTKKAYTEAECNAHGLGCQEANNWNPDQLNASECHKCGGTVTPLFQWATGNWVSSKVVPLKWMQKQMVPLNQWTSTVDMSKLQNEFYKAIGSILTRLLINDAYQRYSVYIGLLERIACDCTGTGSNCFGNITVSTLASCRSDPGVASTCGGVQVNTGGNSSVSITVDNVPASNFATSSGGASAHGRAAAVINYNVIKDASNTLVGQLIGDGKQITVTGDLGNANFSVCLSINPQIVQNNASYPVYDFCQGGANGSPGVPLNTTVQVVGLQLCGTVSSQGTYYPVIRSSSFVGKIANGGAGANTTTTAMVTMTNGNNVMTTGGNVMTTGSNVQAGMTSATVQNGPTVTIVQSSHNAAKQISPSFAVVLIPIMMILFQ